MFSTRSTGFIILTIFTFFLASILPAAASGPNEAVPFVELKKPSDEPVASSSYGHLFDRSGKPIKATPQFVREAVQYYLNELLERTDGQTRERFEKFRAFSKEQMGLDKLTHYFLQLEWLNKNSEMAGSGRRSVIFSNLRGQWYKELMGLKDYLESVDPETKFPRAVAEFGVLEQALKKKDWENTADYSDSCLKAGVPTPPDWPGLKYDRSTNKFDVARQSDWVAKGEQTKEFILSGYRAEVFEYQSRNPDGSQASKPDGLCIALPRLYSFQDKPGSVNAIGIICLGRKTGNACFYDIADVPHESELPLSRFLHGGNVSNGECTDCHSGENPFVIHPLGALGRVADRNSPRWYEPLIRPDFPRNFGPGDQITGVPLTPTDKSCLECHVQNNAGRFPDILALNRFVGTESEYCIKIMKRATRAGSTMPVDQSQRDKYFKHLDAMKQFCGMRNVPAPRDVETPDIGEPELVSSVIIEEPLYGCARTVEVSSSLTDASLVISIDNGTSITRLPAQRINEPSSTIVRLPNQLDVGDQVSAVVTTAGGVSVSTPAVQVVSHLADYPGGRLPAPRIDPTTVHACGQVIAVRHVRGANVIVTKDDTVSRTVSGSGVWSNIRPPEAPIDETDTYRARQFLCEEPGPKSNQVTAVAEPNPLPTPRMSPTPRAGQKLIALENLPHGAITEVESQGQSLSRFATAVTYDNEINVANAMGRPIQQGDQFDVTSTLCEKVKVSFPKAEPCETLPPPRIQTPLVGENFVTVTNFVPSARIRIFDASGTEIGSASGSKISLTRAIRAGDVLTVTQQLDRCISNKAFQIAAICYSKETCKKD